MSANAFINGSNGSFASVRLTDDHVTLVVEGRDSRGPAVAGMPLSLDGVDQLIRRLTNVRGVLARRLGRANLTTTVTSLNDGGHKMHRP